jgi:hypothetical protein
VGKNLLSGNVHERRDNQVKILPKQITGARRLATWLGIVSEGGRAFLLERLPKDSVGAEIGVHLGDFAAEILERVKPYKFHLIDPWRYEDSELYSEAWYGGKAKGGQQELDARHEAVLHRFKALIDIGKVEVHRGTSEEVAKNFPDAYFDWVYIDGNHLYEYIKKDLEIYSEKIKAGGYLTGDDYTEGGWWGGGVKRAVDEFIKAQNVQLIEIKKTQFIIQKVEA